MEKRVILAIIISIIVTFLYAIFIGRFYPKTIIYKETKIERGFSEQKNKEFSEEIYTTLEPKKEMLENNRLKLVVNNIGGSIEEILLKDTEFGSPKIVKDALFEKGIFSLNTNLIKEAHLINFEIKKHNGIIFLSKEIEGLRIEKRISLLDKKLGVLAEIVFKNLKEAPIDLDYKINLGSRFFESVSQRGFFEIGFARKDRVSWISAHKIRNSKDFYQNDTDWVAMKDRFLSLIIKPIDVPHLGLETSGNESNRVIFLKTQNFRILPGQEALHRFILYAGPSSLRDLKEFGYGFEKSLSFGVFSIIAEILLTILGLFYKIFKNYGVAIILLSILINFILCPLTLKSFKSMRQIQQLQPQINRLRDEFKDNPQRLNKELMELYKKYKVNPFGGCLPMLLQMPVFFALYQTFMRSTELKSQGFLWIKDLSGPDALFRLNFRLPILGDSLNLLPILMTLAMFFQQRLSGLGTYSEQPEQQKLLAFMMPILFGFIFYNLPAGLVLYWFISTITGSILQFAIIRKS